MRYRGETGFSVHARVDCHEKQIRANDQKNSMAQHLSQNQPDQVRNKDVFSFKVITTGERSLTRQLREAQKTANDIPSLPTICPQRHHRKRQRTWKLVNISAEHLNYFLENFYFQ